MKSGEVKDEIFRTIADQHADVVVMGTHGRGLFGRWLIGSVTEAMLRKVSIPILTVCRSMQPLSFNRILFATDLSESSKRKFGFVLDLARTLRSDVTLVHVLEPVSVTYGGEMAEYVNRHNAKEAGAELDRLIPELTPEDIRIDASVVDGSAAEEILKAAELNSADLIMITVQPKGIVERALLGTTAERVIREADIPVLSIPAKATEGISHKEEQETHKVL
jgi:nucleotide-binding universal stress UspA family protein